MKLGDEVELTTAESLGVILYCNFCDVAICEWDSETRSWILDLTEPDENGQIACWNCLREKVTPPTHQQVEELLRSVER